MAQSASDLIKGAENLYGAPLTPDVTRDIRQKLESGIAEALGLLANTILCDYLNRWNGASRQNLVDAEDAVNLALDFAADMPSPYYARAFFNRANGDHQQAYDDLATSLTYNPGSVRSRGQMAAELLYLGRFEEALNEIDRAIDDGKDSPALGMFQWIKGRTLFFMGRYGEAIPCLQDSIDRHGNLWYNRLYLVSAKAQFEKMSDARSDLAEFRSLFQGYNTIAEVIAAEQTNPNKNEAVKRGRAAFHAGLETAGLQRE